MGTGSPAPDEYQVVGFILTFKGTQFISSGVCMAIISAVRFYLCVHPDGKHTCDVDGPGATQDVLSGAIDMIGSCILVWVAFYFLPITQRSAGMRDLDNEADPPVQGSTCCGYTKYEGKGGRLTKLLGYDFFCFLVALVLLGLMHYNSTVQEQHPGDSPDQKAYIEATKKWEFRTAVFSARICYSLLMLPFVVFAIPGLNGILTHTIPTGYNRNGLCVPFTMHPMPEKPDKSPGAGSSSAGQVS